MNRAKYFCRKTGRNKKALRFHFILKMFRSPDICMFQCPLFKNEYAVMVLSYAACRGKYIYIKKKNGWLSKINIWVIFTVKPFLTEMCILSNLFFSIRPQQHNVSLTFGEFYPHFHQFQYRFVQNVKFYVIMIKTRWWKILYLCTSYLIFFLILLLIFVWILCFGYFYTSQRFF